MGITLIYEVEGRRPKDTGGGGGGGGGAPEGALRDQEGGDVLLDPEGGDPLIDQGS